MGKYMVIGASGDIGSQITRDLLLDGHEVIAQYFSADITQLKEQFIGQAISFYSLTYRFLYKRILLKHG